MTKVTLIGATGSLGRVVTKTLLEETDVDLVLFSRSANRLPEHRRVIKKAASVSDSFQLERAIRGSSLVFVALSGNLPNMIVDVIDAMKATATKRIVFITSYGIYGEQPGQNGRVVSILQPYRKAADILEASDLDYTILRPGWFDNSSDLSYQLYPKGEVITGNNISRLAIAQVVKNMVLFPERYVRDNLGIVRG
ncbi:NAD(P)H-binding protein [Streptococcus uberis]|uniref:NAD(P)H-binding protein n=1 Tax=Streptococcus uberis TaxID=1349 RepID=UPI001FF28536|nr:NAD(P)H-binding protein [Streptococcus uberis]MCK1160318.1 NAD(P)H-binding protein [Streptococcus uberis]MCK1162104.1 NAD(P)H-binding protein [Streptococcus uberis]MCK1240683.1 NAD(P)H-binding protein [Streptococcus uberis]